MNIVNAPTVKHKSQVLWFSWSDYLLGSIEH
ncbi:hypothetical protein ABIF83_004535 [Bradyrhizobium ottawaense]